MSGVSSPLTIEFGIIVTFAVLAQDELRVCAELCIIRALCYRKQRSKADLVRGSSVVANLFVQCAVIIALAVFTEGEFRVSAELCIICAL